MTFFKRFHSPKKWSQIYVENAEDQRDSFRAKELSQAAQRNENMNSIMARNFVSKNLGRIVRKKLKTRTFSVRTTMQNIEGPEENEYEWDPSLPSQTCCDVCVQPCVNDTLTCQSCSVTYHRNCFNGMFPGKKKKYKRIITMDEQPFMCFTCKKGNQDDVAHYQQTITDLKRTRHVQKSHRIVLEFVLAYLVRTRFLKIKRIIVKFQAYIRCKFQRRRFNKVRRDSPYVVKVDIKSIPSLFKFDAVHDSFQAARIIVTCVDTMRGTQFLRFEKPVKDALHEGFIIPGVTVSFSIVITAVKHMDLYGQTQIPLRDLAWPYRSKDMASEPLPKVSFPPSTSDGGQSSSYQWDLRAMADVFATWQTILEQKAVDDEAALRTLTEGMKDRTHHHDAKGKRNSVTGTHKHNSDKTGKGKSTPTHTDDGMDGETFEFKYVYRPVGSLKSMCGSCVGPSLDFLRKAAEQFGHLAKNKEVKRATRYWVCLADMRLRFYAFYGDSQCRIEEDISKASVTNVRNVVTIRLEDKRSWQLEFETPGEAATMTFVAKECRTPSYVGVPRRRKLF
jgi:hypothetical protein